MDIRRTSRSLSSPPPQTPPHSIGACRQLGNSIYKNFDELTQKLVPPQPGMPISRVLFELGQPHFCGDANDDRSPRRTISPDGDAGEAGTAAREPDTFWRAPGGTSSKLQRTIRAQQATIQALQAQVAKERQRVAKVLPRGGGQDGGGTAYLACLLRQRVFTAVLIVAVRRGCDPCSC